MLDRDVEEDVDGGVYDGEEGEESGRMICFRRP